MTEGAEPQEARPPRLSPFALPSETTFRFVLLVVAVLGTTLYVWNWIYAAVDGNAERYALQAAACLQLAPGQTTNLDEFRAGSGALGECVQNLNQDRAWWMLGGAALVLGFAVLLAVLRPWWTGRRRRLVPLDEDDAPAIVARVRRLAAEAGLARTPRLVWNPLDPAPTGLAYGHLGRYTVALTGGLVVRATTDREAFDAVVRHELAHIRNRDVDLTYFTVSLWHAFLLGAVAPFALTLLDESVETVGRVTWRLAALAVLVYLTRNSVLRSREVYADVRASVGAGAREAVERVLASLPRAPRGRLARVAAVHPDPEARLETVRDTRRLFALDLLTAFGAGVAATVAYQSVVDLVSAFLTDPLDMRFVAALAFAPAVVGVVGLAVWRSDFGALAQGLRTPPTWRLGLALAAGFMVGPELALVRSVATSDDAMLGGLLEGRGLWWVAGLVAAVTLVVVWVSAGASSWLRALAGRRSRAAAAAGLVSAAAVLTIVLGIFYVSRDLREITGISRSATARDHELVGHVVWAGPEWVWQLVLNPQLAWVLQREFVLPAVVLLWALPLGAALVRRRSPDEADARWAFLDPGGRLRIPPFTGRLWRPLLVGAVGGLAFLLAEIVLRTGIHYGMDAATRRTNELLLAFFVWQLALALLAQAVAAAVATALAGRHAGVVDGLAAAFVTGSIAWFGIVGGPAAGGCVDPVAINPAPCAWTVEAGFAWDLYRRIVVEGALVALAAGLVVAGILSLVHSRQRADDLRTADAVPG